MRPVVSIPVDEANRWLDHVRDKTGLSLTEIANRSNLSASTLTRPRRGQGQGQGIKIATLRRIAHALRVPLPAEFTVLSRNAREKVRAQFQELALEAEQYADPERKLTPAQRSAFIDGVTGIFHRLVQLVERGDLVPVTEREAPEVEPKSSRQRGRSEKG